MRILLYGGGARLGEIRGAIPPAIGDEVVIDEVMWRVVRRRWLVYEDPDVTPQVHVFMARGPNG